MAAKKPPQNRSEKATSAPPKRVGRPPKKPSDRREARIMLRLTHAEAASIAAAAERAGKPIATWIAEVAIRATGIS